MMSHRTWAVALVVAGVVIATHAGCRSLNLAQTFENLDFTKSWRKKDKPKDTGIDDDFATKLETKLIGEYTSIAGLNMLVVEGVGLVVGLNGTGGDPPPSRERSRLLQAMRKHKIQSPNRMLADKNTALVIVRAYLPPLVKKGDRFDIEVRSPDGGDVTSLEGGWLLPTDLTEKAVVSNGKILDGHILARAEGPVLITAAGESDEDDLRSYNQAGLLRRGRIISGGISMKERNLAVGLRSKYKGTWMAQRVADQVNARFSSYSQRGFREGLAKAKTDQLVELKLHPQYQDNYPRYLQVIRHLPSKETPMVRRLRIQKLRDDLQNPALAPKAAMQLEGIGKSAVPILRAALDSPHPECRFHAACSLCYLGQSHGIPELIRFIRDEPAFRVYALASIAATRDAEAQIALRKLLDSDSVETRYGCFRALTTMDSDDPFLAGLVLPKNAERGTEQFKLHTLNVKGPPLVHITQHHKAEVVIFGKDVRFRTPIALRAGPNILVTAASGSNSVVVASYRPGRRDQRKVVSTRVADVIKTVAEFGGRFPEVSSLLMQADKQQNLPASLGIDALPKPGRYYDRGNSAGTKRRSRIGGKHLVPGQFQTSPRERRGKVEDAGEDLEPEPAEPTPAPAEAAKPNEPRASTESATTEKQKRPSLTERLRMAGRRPKPAGEASP